MEFTLPSIYPDIKKRIADYLCPDDAISLGKTCKSIRDDLDLKILVDVYTYSKHFQKEHVFRPVDYHEGDAERIWFRFFPIVLTNPVHTIRFSCSFHDQGWGNRRGKLYIRQDKNENNYQGDIIAESPIASHEETDIYIQFRPEPGQKYTMCYVIGGGGGHELYIKYPQVQTLFYHNAGVVDAADLLKKKDIAPIRDSKFGLKMLIGVVDRLIADNNRLYKEGDHEQKIEEDDTLAQSIASVGFNPRNNKELEALKKFLELLLKFKYPAAMRKRR